MTDGILLAEMQRDRDAAPLRHDHHRRGARAQPQHRLPPRLPQAAAAAPARPQGDHHLGDDRPRALRRALRRRRRQRRRRSSRSPAAPTRSRSATGPLVDPDRPEDDERDQVTGDRARPSRSCGPSGAAAATSSSSSPASARSATPPTRSTALTLPQHRGAAALRAAVRRRAAPGLRAAHRPADRAGHQRRRDLADRAGHPLRRRRRHRAHLPLQPAHQGAAAADRADLPGQRQPAGRPVRPRRRRHLHPALLRGGLRRAGPSSPSPRSCAPTWPRSSCR